MIAELETNPPCQPPDVCRLMSARELFLYVLKAARRRRTARAADRARESAAPLALHVRPAKPIGWRVEAEGCASGGGTAEQQDGGGIPPPFDPRQATRNSEARSLVKGRRDGEGVCTGVGGVNRDLTIFATRWSWVGLEYAYVSRACLRLGLASSAVSTPGRWQRELAPGRSPQAPRP